MSAVLSAPQLRTATRNDVDRIVDFLLKHFITTEPLTKALNLSPEFPPLRELLSSIAMDCVEKPTSFVAEGQGGILLGVILNKLVSVRDYMGPTAEGSDSDSPVGDVCEQQHALNMLIKVLVDMEQELPQDLLANPLLKDVHGTEELASFGDIGFGQILCVAKDSSTRRQGLGLKLANIMFKRQAELGVRLSVGTCTAKASQGMATNKTGGSPLRTLNYSELTLTDGTPVKCHDGTDKAVLMITQYLKPNKAQL